MSDEKKMVMWLVARRCVRWCSCAMGLGWVDLRILGFPMAVVFGFVEDGSWEEVGRRDRGIITSEAVLGLQM
jgi:hypothetical protein